MNKIIFLLIVTTVAAGYGCRKETAEYIIPDQPSIEMIKITEGPWYDAIEMKREYLNSLDPDRLLFHFRKVAGIPTNAKEYGGWEMEWRELRGHSIGHYLTAGSMMYQLTKDTVLLGKCEYIVRELRECQNILGTGYVSAFPEEYLDRVENIERVWAPYYTIHKIIAGLFDFYLYCGNETALETALDFTHYLYDRINLLEQSHFQKVLDRTEQGGMNELLWNIYAETGDTICMNLAMAFYQHSYFDPLANKIDHLKGYHSNSFIPNVVGVAREYQITGDISKKQIAEFFWDQVVTSRSFVTGGTSNGEHWNSDPHHLHTEIGPGAHESCCTYNMIKLSNHIWSWSDDVKYHDYIERALINAILPAINRETGMSMYYVSMAPGYYKTWDTPDSSFWCCTGTGMENYVRIANYIYSVKSDRLFINQFVSSTINFDEQDFALVQNSTLPGGNNVNLEIKTVKPLPLKLAIRIPEWSGNDYKVLINNKIIEVKPAAGSYMLIDRIWNNGDKLDITFSPKLWYSLLPVTNNYVAFGFGPVVLSARFSEPNIGANLRHRYGPYDGEPIEVPTIEFSTYNIEDYIEVVDMDNLHFRVISESGMEVDLVPFYDILMEHFSVYLPINISQESIYKKRVDPSVHI